MRKPKYKRKPKSKDEKLQNPEEWDFESGGEVRPTKKAERTVISVAFPHEGFEKVSARAREAGVSLSAFVREAALERASQGAEVIGMEFSGASTGSFYSSAMPASITRSPYQQVDFVYEPAS